MSQTTATIIISSFFSFTGIIWGFILAATCVEELEEMYNKIQKTKLLLAVLTTAALFYISTQVYPNKNIIAIIFFLLGISTLTIGLKLQNNKYEYLTFIPITAAYIAIIFYQIPKGQFLLLASSTMLYFFVIGISLHAKFLGINHQKKPNKKIKFKK